MMVEKDRKLFVDFIGLEKAYDKLDRENAVRIYRAGGHLLERIRSFYEDVSLCMNVEVSENFSVGVGDIVVYLSESQISGLHITLNSEKNSCTILSSYEFS